MIKLQTYTHTRLAWLVKSFWCLKVSELANTPYQEDILPDGHHEIIFHLNNQAKRIINHTGWVHEPDAFIAGQSLKSYSLELKNHSILYGIRFYPYTLRLLFGFPAEMITDTILPLNEIAPASILKSCITENPDETFANFENTLVKLVSVADFQSSGFKYVQYAVQHILQYKGDVRVDDLIHGAGISHKYLDTLFKQFVGINPKMLCNIIKLNHFINYKTHYPHKWITECCYEANFYDQSHLIKLFKAFTGKLPKAYFKDTNYINNYFAGL